MSIWRMPYSAKRVDQRVHHRGQRAGATRLAAAFGAERVGGGRHRVELVHEKRARLRPAASRNPCRSRSTAGRHHRRRWLRSSAWPMPCTMPPCAWPSTSSGLMTTPKSLTKVYLHHLDHRRYRGRPRPRRCGSRSGRPKAGRHRCRRRRGLRQLRRQLSPAWSSRGQLHQADRAVGAGDDETAARGTRCRPRPPPARARRSACRARSPCRRRRRSRCR